MEYFKDNDFFEKMEKVAVPKLDAGKDKLILYCI